VFSQRVNQRVGPDLIERIVAEYQSGASSVLLMARYGIGKGTVLRLLRQNGIVLRKRGPSRSS
jgi:hypothetical protein